MLRRLSDLPFVVVLLVLAALAMLLPAAHATVNDADRIARIFAQSAGMTALLALFLALATMNRPRATGPRSHLVWLAASWLLLPPVLALPLWLAVPDTTFANAWFEMVSCFTTTGATLYDAPGRLNPSLHLWRALVGWLGGFFTLVTAGAILAPLTLAGSEVVSGRTPGRGSGLTQITHTATTSERLRAQASVLLPAYAGFTLLLWVALLMAGEDGLIAFCHALSTLSTSGITPGTQFEEMRSGILGEVAVAALLVLALSRRLLPGPNITGTGRLRDDPELRLAAFLMLLVPAVLALRHLWSVAVAGDAEGLEAGLRAFWGAAFTVLSFLTTTGFESGEWDVARDWLGAGSPGLALTAVAMIGGGVATTAGGVKLLRMFALFRLGQRELQRTIHPNAVAGGGPDERRLRGEGALAAWVFFMLYATAFGVTTALLTLTGLDFTPALVLAISALTLTGPLAQVAIDTPVDWLSLGLPAKAVLGLAMTVGRLEILAVLVLFSPDLWRR